MLTQPFRVSALSRIRTALFVPADDAHRCARAWSAGADAVIVDLEDAVSGDAKADARAQLKARLRGAAARVTAVVRINAVDSEAGRLDIEALANLPVDAVMVPKADPPAVRAAARLGRPIIALIETAAGVLAAPRTAGVGGVARIMFGPVDFAAELGADPAGDFLYARSQIALVSAAAGLSPPLDGPCMNLADTEQLLAEATRARGLGFGGKACVHPKQIPVVSEAFRPSAEEIDWAIRVKCAYETATRQGRGVVSVGGQVVDAPVARRAYRILDRQP
ncbi:MAG: CoA ester lyase [Gemmatimonas sp.]|nr:CoA ester lyase [Gemmatimonas sp.]